MSGFRKKNADRTGDLVLRNGRLALPDGQRVADLAIANGRIAAIGDSLPASHGPELDLHGLLVAPGLVDADHDLAADAGAAILPGPYLDRSRRDRELPETRPNEADAAEAAAALIKEGVTALAGPTPPPEGCGLRHLAGPRIAAVVFEPNPARVFSRARGGPVFVSVADGDSRAMAREIDVLDEQGGLLGNLVAIGGTGLRRSQAERLAAAGATLVWRPVTDEFVLGRTLDADVADLRDLRLLIGAGARRDGGRGLIAALRRADALGLTSRRRLVDAVTANATALGARIGAICEGWEADLAVWDAPDLETALFLGERPPLRMTIGGGKILWRDEKCFT